MNIQEQIDKDYMDAYKAQDAEKVQVLRMVKTALKNREIEKRAPLEEPEMISTVKKEVKQREESAGEYQKGGRAELAEKELNEAKILSFYLPAQVDEETVRKIVKETIAELNISDPAQKGRLIGAVMAKLSGRTDGSTVAKIVNQELS